MANEKQVRSALEAATQVGAAFLVAGTEEIARIQADYDALAEAVMAHLDIISGKITGGIVSPTLVLASALDLKRLIDMHARSAATVPREGSQDDDE